MGTSPKATPTPRNQLWDDQDRIICWVLQLLPVAAVAVGCSRLWCRCCSTQWRCPRMRSRRWVALALVGVLAGMVAADQKPARTMSGSCSGSVEADTR